MKGKTATTRAPLLQEKPLGLSYEQILHCMHCGMCLTSCPTYLLTGHERSSPRGRLALMRAVAEGHLPITETFAEEMFFCLGCLACTTACPAGVEYGPLLEEARAQVVKTQRGSWVQSLMQGLAFGLFLSPRRMQAAARLLRWYQRFGLSRVAQSMGAWGLLPGNLKELEQLLPPIPRRFSRHLLPEILPAEGREKARVGMLLGCVMDIFFVRENLATAQVLARNGCTVVVPKEQGCCGALHAHFGFLEKARQLARRLIASFEAAGVDFVIVNSAGCGSTMKEYGRLLVEDPSWAQRAAAFSAKVRDVHEFLVELPYIPPTRPLRIKVTYHDACHLAHAQGITRPPRQLLQAIPGVEYVELPLADRCCGSAGVYNIIHFPTAMRLLEEKVENILRTGAEVVGVANPGCLLQIRYGLRRRGASVRAEHPITLLEEAYS